MSQPSKDAPQTRPGKVTHEDVARIAGPIEDERIVMILAAEPTAEELEEAVAWAAGEGDIVGKLERPLSGTVAELYAILTTDEAFEEER
jgi:hypothetical protein